MLLINIKFKFTDNYNVPSFIYFLFSGKYTDLTPEWFVNVGSIIITTMLINIVVTPLYMISFRLLALIF